VTVRNRSVTGTSYTVYVDAEPDRDIAPGESDRFEIVDSGTYSFAVIGSSGPMAGGVSNTVEVHASWWPFQSHRTIVWDF